MTAPPEPSVRVLYLHPGLVPPPKDPAMDRFYHVPAPVGGDVLMPVWARDADAVRRHLGPDSWPEHRAGNFTYHLCPAGRYRYGDIRQKLMIFAFYLREGLRLRRARPYQCVMCYGWMLTGFAAVLLHWLTGAKLIVELPAVPEDAYRFSPFGRTYSAPRTSLATRLMARVSDFMLHLAAGRASRLKLLYPAQLAAYPKLRNVPADAFHSLVPVARVPYTGASARTVLLVGAPWYLKGADVLVRAFQQIENEFPDWSLQLMGYYPDRTELDRIVGASSRIEILPARPHGQTLELIAGCGVFVLPSRTEGAGRVLIEAMAAGKPLIGSRVGGIVHYIEDGANGFLFESGNADELAARLRTLLASPETRLRMGEEGRRRAFTRYDEASFGRQFRDLIVEAAR